MSREQELDITVSAVLPSVPVSVKSAENAGDGTSANRCILEVYENGVFSGARYVAPVQDMGAVFEDVHLIAGGSYELVFWADCASEGGDGSYADLYYGTEAGLTQIRAEVAFSHIFTMDVTVDLLPVFYQWEAE